MSLCFSFIRIQYSHRKEGKIYFRYSDSSIPLFLFLFHNVIRNYNLDLKTHTPNIGTDIHQSFNVPTIAQVRQNNNALYGNSEYTYLMAYPLENNIQKHMQWIHENMSTVMAGVVYNDMNNPNTFSTFAGFLANVGMIAGTYEMGTIGKNGTETFTPQLMNIIRGRIMGFGPLLPEYRMKFDTWNVEGSIIKKFDNFTFLDPQQRPSKKAPIDFFPQHSVIAQQNNTNIFLLPNQRILFANADIPNGDRAGVIIAPLSSKYTNDWMN